MRSEIIVFIGVVGMLLASAGFIVGVGHLANKLEKSNKKVLALLGS